MGALGCGGPSDAAAARWRCKSRPEQHPGFWDTPLPAAPARPLPAPLSPLTHSHANCLPFLDVQMQGLLVEQLCCELLRSGSLECDCTDDAGDSCCSSCVAGSSPSPLPALGVEAPAAVAEAAEAVMSLLQGCSSAAAAAPALSGLFPSASTFEVALPAAAGGGHAAVPLLPAAGSAATVRCSAPAQLRPVVFAAARCTLTTPVPLPPPALQLLAAFAAELGLALGQALKEQREVGTKARQGQDRGCSCREGR